MTLSLQKNKLFNDFPSLSGRIGILGGTFDPVHNGHLQIARFARQKEQLDSVVFIPNKMNPLKRAVPSVSDAARLEMLLRAVEDEPGFFVSDMELRKEFPSFTVDTLGALKASIPSSSSLFFILGSDSLPSLHLWWRYEDLFSLATIVTVARRDFPFEKLGQLSENVPQRYLSHLEEHFVQTEYIDISASELREKLRHHSPLSEHIPEEVVAYIKQEKLYL